MTAADDPVPVKAGDPAAGMVRLPGGAFTMGSARFYPEERPPRPAAVQPFWIDATPVTNAAFARFVSETGHRTQAERGDGAAGAPGSLVFVAPAGPVDLADPSAWWSWVEGACWWRPTGPGSDLAGLEAHPVVHVSFSDALAYAAWTGKALPTEAEWEFAARGGLDGADYAWGNAFAPDGQVLANTWQGAFPHENLRLDGWARTSPVGSYPANGWDLHDLIGNVWEWTVDDWRLPGDAARPRSCCASGGHGDAGGRGETGGRSKVIKGGSYLCAPSYCQRYRPAARQPRPADEGAGHVGFRCVLRSSGAA